MANPPRPASFLPAIKCSDCGAEIEISKMGDHVCISRLAVTPDAVEAAPKATKSFFDRAARLSNTMRLGRPAPPPRIDSSVANKPFLHVAPSTPTNGPGTARSLSPSLSKPPQLQRSHTSPMPRAYTPPSPDLPVSQDGAFPYFPTSRAASPQPKKKPVPSHDYLESGPRSALLGPGPRGSDSVMRKMNTIAPGPFDGRSRKPSVTLEPAEERPSHKRTQTLSSLRSRSRSGASDRSGNNGHHERQVSTASSAGSRMSMRSNGPAGLPEEGPKGRPGPPPRPARPDAVDTFLEQLQEANQPTSAGSNTRPQTLPLRKENTGGTKKSTISSPRRPSEYASQNAASPRPLLSRAATVPVEEAEPEWWDGRKTPTVPQHPTTQENARRFPRRTSSRSINLKTDFRLDDAPPVPPTPQLDPPSLGTLHTPTDSASSEDSSGYDGRSNSSRSTPPTSPTTKGPCMVPFRNPSYDKEQPRGAPRHVGPNVPRPPTSQSRSPPPEPHRNTSVTTPPVPLPVIDQPDSPMDPAIQRGLFIPRRPSDTSALPDIQSVVQSADLPSMPPMPSEEELKPVSRTRTASVGKRPGTATKGNCRGCGELIVGKSVKAADGRLTGRWHRQCFVCKTCRSPFQTADFYVINNFPYCAHHYHQLNGSLCQGCKTGIEGQYLETERRQKFHPQCFSCDTCRIPLRDDYFDVGGVVYCERHAWHVARQTGGTGPGGMLAPGGGRRNPERRRTRLMMM